MRRNTQLLAAVLLCLAGAVAGYGGRKRPTHAPSTPASEFPEVQTPQGRLRGSLLRSLDGRTIYSFRGVRYAQPPVGELRFKPPVPVSTSATSSRSIVDATKDGAFCPSIRELNTNATSEDCLFLNVYTTKLPDRRGNPRRPVMIFLHPGALYLFRGSSDLFGPQYLMDEDIVLVTLNYRLGALGFLSTGDSVLPGNNGFKDQVMAFRWVQQNIALFGGDPGSVTIAGYSAGSISVYLHMLSPMSRGLFHRGMAMSGADLTKGITDPLGQARLQARLVNCTDTTSEEIINCLKGKDAFEIAESAAILYQWNSSTPSAFGYVVEQDLGDGAERFVTADVTEQLLKGNFAQIPLISGSTKDELTWLPIQTLEGNFSQSAVDSYVTALLTGLFQDRNATELAELIQQVKEFYFNDRQTANETGVALGQLYSDIIVIFPVDRATKLVSRRNTAPVYYYHFVYQGRYSWAYLPGTQTPYGVSHHDDLIYLFYISALVPEFVNTDPEYTTVKRMTKMWANFVKTGNPTSEKTDLVNVNWETLTPSTPRHLQIGSQLTMKQGLFYEDRIGLWERLSPLPNVSRSSRKKTG
ncbi:esterase E4-like [Schistocerca piceifrons]|uniref:esterase E4-like n=1 Tax=Schistocerca piceifrons TaxID=274613 RepID=UPI001F5E71BE|nr:esterase E4-like [Schistocerca piceifrons]